MCSHSLDSVRYRSKVLDSFHGGMVTEKKRMRWKKVDFPIRTRRIAPPPELRAIVSKCSYLAVCTTNISSAIARSVTVSKAVVL